MATEHTGNIIPQIELEEHDGANNAKRVNVVAGGVGQATVTPLQAWPDPKTYIGLVTITGSLAPAAGNVTLDPGSRTGIVGNLTLSDPKGFIGLVTVVGSLSPAAGNVTLDPGSKTGIVGNVTLSDAKTYIGLVTVTQASSARTITGNVTLSDAKTYVGLTTSTLGASTAGIGFATVNVANSVGIAGNVTLSDSKTFVGLVTAHAAQGTSPWVSSLVGNVTISDSKGFLGLVTVVQSSAARTITGNVTLSDAKTYVGLVTNTPAYGSNSTVVTGVISASGNATLLVAPASNRFFIKNLHVSSLGRAEIEFKSGATTLIPFTSLSTTSGFTAHYGEQGLPARAQTDALVANLNGAATVSIMANVRFEA